MSTKVQAKEVVDKYLTAWQKQDKGALRSLLSEDGRYGGGRHSPDSIVEHVLSYPAWKDVRMLNSIYDDDGNAAIMYEEVDPQTGRKLRSTEFFSIDEGKINKLEGAVIGGAAISSGEASRLSVVDAI